MPISPEWQQQIERAQKLTHYPIGDHLLPRIKYGDESEDWKADRIPCHDCGVTKGQLHVPSCDVEE